MAWWDVAVVVVGGDGYDDDDNDIDTFITSDGDKMVCFIQNLELELEQVRVKVAWWGCCCCRWWW